MDSSTPNGETVTRPLSAQIQQLGQTIMKVQNGELTLDAFAAYLEQYADRLKMLDLPQLEGTDRGDPGVGEALAHHRLLTEQYRSGLDMLVQYTQEQNPELLEQGYQTMATADTLLAMLFEEIKGRHSAHQAASEAAAWIVCPRCSHKNRRGTPSCSQCRFMLPQVVDVRQETDIVGADTSGAAADAVVGPLLTLAQEWQQNGDPAPLLEKLVAMHENYVKAAEKTREMLETQQQQLYPEVKQVMLDTEETLYKLANAVATAHAMVNSDTVGNLEQPIIAIKDLLNDLADLRAQFGQLARQFARG